MKMGSTAVLDSAICVMLQSKHVTVSTQGVTAAAAKIADQLKAIRENAAAGFDKELHYFDGGPMTAQYLLVVDSLNFCFWPDGELEYEHLAGGIKATLLKDPSCLDAARLATINGAGVRELIGWHRDLPQQEERARLLREVGCVLQQQFNGQAAELVASAQRSAVRLVEAITAHLPGFRDHAVYKGRQVFFYKRAQIFVGDLYGAFAGQGLGQFDDIDKLTMFADYRVPVVLRLLGVLQYTPQLTHKVDTGEELPAGSEEELEIRAASIMAVEQLKHAANALVAANSAGGHHPQQQPADSGQPQLLSIQLDWWLWQEGERERTQHPHHKTWTIYY